MRAVLVVASALLFSTEPAHASSVLNLTTTNAAPSTAAGARTVQVVRFTTSPTGALGPSGQVNITLPAGTGFSAMTGGTVRDLGAAGNAGSCAHISGELVRCTLFSGRSILAGAQVEIALNGVTNPATPGNYQLTVATTTDADPATSPAYAVEAQGAVSGVTAVNASPSAAAGARTHYDIDFTTSATGGMSAAANSRITLTFPTGTTFDGYTNGSVRDVAADVNVGSCASPSGLTLQCSFSSGVGPDRVVRVSLNGVTNPSEPGTPTLSVATTSDQSADSQPFPVLVPQTLTHLTVDHDAPSDAAGARTRYIVRFETSSTGGLAANANSRIRVTFPAGTTFAGYTNGSVRDLNAPETSVGSCGGPSGLRIECSLLAGASVPGGHELELAFNGITNPPAASSLWVTVSTTSDTEAIDSLPFSVVEASPLSGLSVNNSIPSRAAGARTQYMVLFTTSETGALANDANSRITVTFPQGTTFAGYTNGAVFEVGAPQPNQVGSCGGPSNRTIQCSLFSGQSISEDSDVRITFNGITNPIATGPMTLTVTTTSDPEPVSSAPFQVVPGGSISGLSVAAGSSAPSTTTQYVVEFDVSPTGGLSNAANSRITVTFPDGTGFASYKNGQVRSAAAGQDVGSCGGPSNHRIECSLFGGRSITPPDHVRVTFNGITNPASAGPHTLSARTTSDTPEVSSSLSSSTNPTPTATPAAPIPTVGAAQTPAPSATPRPRPRRSSSALSSSSRSAGRSRSARSASAATRWPPAKRCRWARWSTPRRASSS
jgi:hypothetical protein